MIRFRSSVWALFAVMFLLVLASWDYKQADLDNLHSKELGDRLFRDLEEVNRLFPNYSRIAHLELMPEDFEMTPKGSIKRYLYK